MKFDLAQIVAKSFDFFHSFLFKESGTAKYRMWPGPCLMYMIICTEDNLNLYIYISRVSNRLMYTHARTRVFQNSTLFE